MANEKIETARSGKMETLDEVLIRQGFLDPDGDEPTDDERIAAILTRIQYMYVPDQYMLMWEDWDWLVILQCLQAHGLFRTNPSRPPFRQFVLWCDRLEVPEVGTKRKMRAMSYVNTEIEGARYPWNGVYWEEHILARWRVLYRTLDLMLTQADIISSHDM